MSSIKDEIQIHAPAAKVHAALATQSGIRGWWNQAGEVDETAGGQLRLHFIKDGHAVEMTFRIDELTANAVLWSCEAHSAPDWVGTTVAWRLRASDGATLVDFEHAGWKAGAPPPVVGGWKHFLGSLKAYVETGTGQPW